MSNWLSFFLAWRYVHSRQKAGFSAFISASSTVGIALGVMVLIIVLSAMNGFQRELAQKLLSIVPHAELMSMNEPITNWRSSLAKIRQFPQVVAAAPVIKLDGLLQKGTKLKAVEIRGVDPSLELTVSDIAQYIHQGSWQALQQPYQLIIGQGIAKKLQINVGDTVQLLLPRVSAEHSTRQFQSPIKTTVTVGGIFNFGGTIDDGLGYLSLKDAGKIIGDEQGVSGIRLKVNDIFQAPKIAREVAYHIDFYVYIYDWTYSQGHLFSDIQLVRLVMFIVLTLVIAVASFNIVSTLVMAVNEKRGDIAILKTMGARPSTLMACFMLQGIINGLLGTSVGAFLGIVLSKNLTVIMQWFERLFNTQFLSADIYFVDHLPSMLQWQDVVVTVSVALILTVGATIYPAWRATKVDPAQVLGQM
jgi:lipoprotein-releasing system permease protein